MKHYSLTHLSDETLRRELSAAAAKEKESTAELLAHIAEFDERKLFLPAGFESMFAYCVGELGLSEDAAKKRIQVARAARDCPEVFEALAAGRVHLTGLGLLAPYLAPGTAGDLLAVATHKSKAKIEELIAARFPRLAVPATVHAFEPAVCLAPDGEGAPAHLTPSAMATTSDGQGAPGHPHDARVVPLSSESYAVQFTRSRDADERFRYLQDLLGHAVSRGDIAEVYDRAVKEMITRMERVRFGACTHPRSSRGRARPGSRRIPAYVRRAVWQRDAGQCTFVTESGRRCEARRGLEFDHAKEYARGGEATVDGIRLRCRGHNQFTAERTFGAGFMREKRLRAAAERKAKAQATRDTKPRETYGTGEPDRSDEDVVLALQTLGYRAGESRRALELCANMPAASPEDKLRRALTYFPRRCHRVETWSVGSTPRTPAPA